VVTNNDATAHNYHHHEASLHETGRGFHSSASTYPLQHPKKVNVEAAGPYQYVDKAARPSVLFINSVTKFPSVKNETASEEEGQQVGFGTVTKGGVNTLESTLDNYISELDEDAHVNLVDLLPIKLRS
jgi:hypothetical protein